MREHARLPFYLPIQFVSSEIFNCPIWLIPVRVRHVCGRKLPDGSPLRSRQTVVDSAWVTWWLMGTYGMTDLLLASHP